MVDVGCGIWEFEHDEFDEVKYIGIDCVKKVIEFNKEKYLTTEKNRLFINANILDDKNNIPTVDLCIIKDVLQHLSNENVKKMLDKVRARAKYVIVVNDRDQNGDSDISNGEYRRLNMNRSPLNAYEPFLLNSYSMKDVCLIGSDTNNFIHNGKRVFDIKLRMKEELSAEDGDKLNKNIGVKIEKVDGVKRVLLAILARNKGHVLDKYLKCIDDLDYNKKLISVYINTNNNIDDTEEKLNKWVEENKTKYENIEMEKKEYVELESTSIDPHAWTGTRFKKLAEIRNKSLKKTVEYDCDYYFVIDCDNFVIPQTLKDLINEDKPIIAPMLKAIPEISDYYSNFFAEITPSGYMKNCDKYYEIFNRDIKGTFNVPVVHCTYLIKRECIEKLNYIDDTDQHEFVIFSRCARKNNIDQYICNKEEYGKCVHFYDDKITLEEEKTKLGGTF